MRRVGVLMGGPSSEHDVSLLSGMNIMRALKGNFEVVPIFITQSGAWLYGKERDLVTPGVALGKIDCIFNALHGEYGEDGTVQAILSHHRIPYTGSEAAPSALAMNKEMTQRILEKEGIRMPKTLVLGPSNLDTRTVFAFSAPPWVIKPRSRGSSVGVSKVTHREELLGAFQKALHYDTHLLVQEYIPGIEVTCGVLENFGGKKIAPLMPLEIIPPDGAHFFDYSVKYNGKTQEIPARFYGPMLARVQDVAHKAHHVLGLRHYSRTDMIVQTPNITKGAPVIYTLEVNTLPGFTSESLFPKEASHMGLQFPDLVKHIVGLTGVV